MLLIQAACVVSCECVFELRTERFTAIILLYVDDLGILDSVMNGVSL